MSITVGECAENRAGEALTLLRHTFQKQEAPLQSRSGRNSFLRTLSQDKEWHTKIKQGQIRLFGIFDDERLIGCCLTERGHILYFCLESRYRRGDAAPLLLDYLRTIHPDLTADVALYDRELFHDCGFEGDSIQEKDGQKTIPMRSHNREITHEIWDLRDELGEPTGRYASRDQYRSLRSGDYMLAVHIFLHTPDGRFLVQKRSLDKDVLPGIWDITGGAAKAGEDGRQAAIRETDEEIGITLAPDQLQLAARLKRKRSFVELWFAKASVRPQACVLQAGEVDEVKLISKKEMINLIRHAKHRDAIYKATAIAAIQNTK